MRRRILAPAVLLLGVVPAAPAEAARPCAPRDASVVQQTQSGTVFSLRRTLKGRPQRFLYGCLRRPGKVYRLGAFGSETPIGVRHVADERNVTLAGRYAGFVITTDFARPPGDEAQVRDSGESMVVRDLRTGRRVLDSRDEVRRTTISGRFVLKANGATAWISSGATEPTRVERFDREGRAVLDSSPAAEAEGPNQIDPDSLALSRASNVANTVLYWLRGGQPKTAPLR